MSINYKLGVVVVLALLASGSVFAKTYGVWLKKGLNDPYVNSAGLKCATGTVDDSVPGNFKMNIEANCFSNGLPTSNVEITGNNAVLQKSFIQTNTTGDPTKDNELVESADGINFSGAGLVLASISKSPKIGVRSFAYTQGTEVVTGSYHLFTSVDGDGVNPVPEPETLWLALIGLAGLALTRRKSG